MADNPQPIAARRQGTRYASVTSAGNQFNADRDYMVREIRFYLGAGTLVGVTARIECEGQSMFEGNAVPVPMLQSAVTNALIGTNGVVVFRPEEHGQPIMWNRTFPIKITPSATIDIVILAEPLA